MLAGLLESDKGKEVPDLVVSYKPQKISPKFPGTVRQLLQKRIKGILLSIENFVNVLLKFHLDALFHPQFQSDVTKPLQIDNILDNQGDINVWNN